MQGPMAVGILMVYGIDFMDLVFQFYEAAFLAHLLFTVYDLFFAVGCLCVIKKLLSVQTLAVL